MGLLKRLHLRRLLLQATTLRSGRIENIKKSRNFTELSSFLLALRDKADKLLWFQYSNQVCLVAPLRNMLIFYFFILKKGFYGDVNKESPNRDNSRGTVLKFAQAVVLLNFHYKVDFVISKSVLELV